MDPTMKYMVVLGSVILVLCVIGGASGLKCYAGLPTNNRTVECSGSCYSYKALSGKSMGCSEKHMKDGCTFYQHEGIRWCWCNSDLCNPVNLHRIVYKSWLDRTAITNELRQERCP